MMQLSEIDYNLEAKFLCVEILGKSDQPKTPPPPPLQGSHHKVIIYDDRKPYFFAK